MTEPERGRGRDGGPQPCFKTSLLLDAELSQIFLLGIKTLLSEGYFFPPFKNVKAILSCRLKQKQAAGGLRQRVLFVTVI